MVKLMNMTVMINQMNTMLCADAQAANHGHVRTGIDSTCFIGRRCSENNAICFPAEKKCDGVIDCPLGSDEADSDCKCKQWGLHDCRLNVGFTWVVYT